MERSRAGPETPQIFLRKVRRANTVEADLRKFAQKQIRRRGKGGQQAFHFFFPAAGHQPYTSRFGRDVADMIVIDQIHQRITHIFHLNAVRAVEVHFKRQDGKNASYVFLQERDAAGAPRPHFGWNEVIYGNIECSGCFCHPEIEFRGVHQENRIRAFLRQGLSDAFQHARNPGKAGQNLHQPHDGKFLHA